MLKVPNMICPECGSKEIQYGNEPMCRSCGLIIDDSQIDHTSFREGTSPIKPKFTNGRIIKEQWMLNCKEKNLLNTTNELHRLASKLALPKYLEEETTKMYKLAVEKDLCIGRDNNSTLYAALYHTCIKYNNPKTINEIIEYTEIEKQQLLRAYKLLKKRLELKRTSYDPIDMLPRFISKLKLSHNCLIKAAQIIEQIKGTAAYSGKNPKSIIAASIYIAAKHNNEKITQRQIANELSIIEPTIRKRYKEITTLLEHT